MDEKEIINVLTNHAQYSNATVINAHTKKEYKVSEAIYNFLDLYNREKEKNKILEKEVENLKELNKSERECQNEKSK